MELSETNKKDSIVVSMEPTGHYWFNLAQYLAGYGIKTVLVNPFHVKRSKELDDNNPTTNDYKDPKTIALLAKDGRYIIPYIPKGLYSELRTAMETRGRIKDNLNAVANRIRRWLSIYFPEFKDVFASWKGKAALVCLQEFPLPEQILEKGIAGIIECWREDKIRGVGVKRATKLFEIAKRSVGFREGLMAAQQELITHLENFELLKRQENRIMDLVEAVVNQIPASRRLLEIKGIGMITVAGFLAEVGDISRFSHPKQVQKYAGLNIKENSSGKHKGSSKITKRGRRNLRALLFRAIMPMVAKNDEFKELHEYYTTRAKNPLKKKQSLVALMCKLIRIFYAILTKDVAYDPKKMMSDIHRPVLQEAA